MSDDQSPPNQQVNGAAGENQQVSGGPENGKAASEPGPVAAGKADGPQGDDDDGPAIEQADQASPSLTFPIVAVGASAGGTEACTQLFANISKGTGMAFVVVTHLARDQQSFLPQILTRESDLPATFIADGLRPEPDHIYCLRPDTHATLQGGVFRESKRAQGVSRPIDEFFQSLAGEQRNLAIGVVLSGMDGDGAVGLGAIRAEGGISIVQTPETARFPDMPRTSIGSDQVDMVLDPESIAFQLVRLGDQFRNREIRRLEQDAEPGSEDKSFGRIIKLLKGVSGVDFRLYKPNTIRRRIARRMVMQRIKSLADYASLLQGSSQELRELQEDVLINVTRFFRDPDVFELFKNSVFPEILEQRPPDQPIRIWSAGCSSGEEVFSLAICLLEALTGSHNEPPIQIFGTDASEQNIQRARLGIYRELIADDVSPERLRRFFVRTDRGYQVSKRVRDLCIFARQNLCHDPPFSRLDLITCRNVLIYFGSQLQRQLIPTFHYALRPEGFLVLGASETIRNFSNLFDLRNRKYKIYAKMGSTPGRALLDVAPSGFVRAGVPDGHTMQAAETWTDVDIQRTADRIVLGRYAPPGVIVDEHMNILQSRGQTAPFLEMAQGSASLQLVRMLRRGIAHQVIPAVKRAIEQDLPAQIPLVEVRQGNETHTATLEIFPLHTPGNPQRTFLVLFVPEDPKRRQDFFSSPAVAAEIDEDDNDRALGQMAQELSSTRLHLQSLLEERDARNQELISANEEIQSANEELQSTNEELETTKEELQSSNEELQTVNDELQNRNTVLTQASNDLINLLNSVNLPVLMLSNEFNIRHFTPQTQRVMNVRTSDIGRPFSDIRLNLNVDNLEPLFTEVLDTLASRELEVQDREGHWYLLRVRPYRTTDNKIDGLIVALVDIDQLRRSQQELRDARDYGNSIVQSVPLPLVVVDSEFQIHSTNEAFAALAGMDTDKIEGRHLPDLAGILWSMDERLRFNLDVLRSRGNGSGTFEFEFKSPRQPVKFFTVRGCVLQPDGHRFVLVTFIDVSAQKEIERLLKAESVRLAEEVQSATRELDRSRDELRALTASLLNTQEEERRRVARELHDDVSQRLASLNMAVERLRSRIVQDPAAAVSDLDVTLADLQQLTTDVRALSHRLHPAAVEHLGLAAALRALTEEFGEREQMIATFFSANVPSPISLDIATGLYRIAQEALRNVSKHAGKTHVKVSLRGRGNSLELEIADAGHGFDMERIPHGLGLISMRERARLIGGTVTVQSALRQGARVTVNVPLPAGEL